MQNHCFWISRGKVFHYFSVHVSRQVLEPTFYKLLLDFSQLGTPFGDLWLHFWGSYFQVTRKAKGFFGLRSWGQAICDPSGRRGELGSIWEGIWEASGSNFDPGGTPGESLGPPWDTFGARPQKNTRNHQKKTFWLFCDLKKWPPKVEAKVSKWSPNMTKNRSKIDKMPALELVLKNTWKNDEQPCLWILKNSGFAL